MSYDSRQDTLEHIAEVQRRLKQVIEGLYGRAARHDDSKLRAPEKPVFDEYTPKLAGATYGSPEYTAFLAGMGEALQHHYAVNDHHPEHGEVDLEWRDIDGFDGRYSISNFGDVRSNARVVDRGGPRGPYETQERILKAQVTAKGYLRIQLGRDGVSANRFVHRLVAEAFLPNPEGKPEVNHKNGIKTDCRLSNLEWATSCENQLHAYENGLREPAVKFVVYCPELDLTTWGCERMAAAARERGYLKVTAAGVWAAMDRGGKHFDLTFEGSSIAEYRRARTADMDLLQLTEMLADWKAATLRHADGDLGRSIRQNAERFGYGPELQRILMLTAKRLGWL